MKAIYSVLSLLLAVGSVSFAQEGQQQTQQKSPQEETKWVIPDVTYTCRAYISKDWNGDKKDSFIILESSPVEVAARTRNTVGIQANTFKVITTRSDLTSVKDSDLGEFEISLKLTLESDFNVALEGVFSLKPKNVKKTVHLVENSDPTAEKIPELLRISTRLMFGTEKDIKKSGPINSFVLCDLKK
jgi:hypothetical protein